MPRYLAGENYPGHSLGLPSVGHGSLASWRSRVAALVTDWAVSMAIAVAVFGTEVITGHGWRTWMTLTVYAVESTVLSAAAGGSLGQLLARIEVLRLDRHRLGLPRAALRAALVSLALPALVIGAERRHLADMAVGTVVVNRR